MPEIETISWKERFGNQFNKSLEPAMTNETGYIKQSRVRRNGSTESAIYNIIYDRDYLSEYLYKIICKPLFVLGKEQILKLVSEAWDAYYGENPVVLPSKREV